MTMTAAEQKRYQKERREVAAKAAAIIAEKSPRTPAEKAALTVVDQDRWVLWHTDHMTDLALAVIRLLSRADLLRDKKHEQRTAKADAFWSADSERRRTAARSAISELDDLVEQVAGRLEAGGDPAEVAKVLRAARDAIFDRQEAATSLPPPDPSATTSLENPMTEHNTLPVQDALFPLTDLQTKGYAKPQSRDEQAADSDDTDTEEAA